MVDFGLAQGRSLFVTAGVAALRRGLQKDENAGLDRKMPFMDEHYFMNSSGSSGLYVSNGGRFSNDIPASQSNSSRQSFSSFFVNNRTLIPMGQARSHAPQSVHRPAQWYALKK